MVLDVRLVSPMVTTAKRWFWNVYTVVFFLAVMITINAALFGAAALVGYLLSLSAGGESCYQPGSANGC